MPKVGYSRPVAEPEELDEEELPGSFVEELLWLKDLRPDERERVARHFRILELPTTQRVDLPATEPPRMGVIVSGSLTLKRAELPGLPAVEIRLGAGDHWGELAVFAQIPSGMEIAAREPSIVALLDHAGFKAIVAEFPIIWVRVAAQLSRELKWKNDLLREIQEFDAAKASDSELDMFLEAKRRRVARHRTGIARGATRIVYQRLIAEPRRDPAFWILLGFVSAIAISRLVVRFILKFKLEQSLFALGNSGGANPTHLHHFNYGFAILILAGLTALFPQSRRFLRALSFVFGIGVGLVFDEFALIWNLNPDYYHSLNYEAQAVLAALLVQIVYFRKFYASIIDRALGRAKRLL